MFHIYTLFYIKTSGQKEQVKAVLQIRIGFNADPDTDPAFYWVDSDPVQDQGF
jgi:hypothetical protein